MGETILPAERSARFQMSLPPNQTMKPTAPDRMTASVFATDPARGLSLSR